MDLTKTLELLLKADAPLLPSALYNLSQLESAEMERLTAIWSAIPTERRRALVKDLVEIAEANFEVDFEQIFRWGLHDGDAEVRAASIEGLWENEEPALMFDLLRLLGKDASARVRAAAASSLGRYVLLSELGKLPSERCEPVYKALYDLYVQNRDDQEIRRRALESLSYVNNEQISALLVDAYEHPEEKMHVSAVFGMGRSADTRWLEIVMGELFSINPEMRYEAARACGEMEARAAVPRLAELVDDPDREVQEVALWALGQIGGDEARRLLLACCEQDDPIARSAAEAALEELDFLHGQFDFALYNLDDDEAVLDW